MSTIEQSIEVSAPISAVYNQWTQFEDFPEFMEGVKSVTQKDDRHLHWEASLAGVNTEWDAEITEQHPDERVAWRSTDGSENAGVVTFHKIDDGTTRVMLQLDVHPQGVTEKIGDALHVVQRRTEGDLERFKDLIEARGGEPTGGWRGDVPR